MFRHRTESVVADAREGGLGAEELGLAAEGTNQLSSSDASLADLEIRRPAMQH